MNTEETTEGKQLEILALVPALKQMEQECSVMCAEEELLRRSFTNVTTRVIAD